jgi:hypothetical protein
VNLFFQIIVFFVLFGIFMTVWSLIEGRDADHVERLRPKKPNEIEAEEAEKAQIRRQWWTPIDTYILLALFLGVGGFMAWVSVH